MFPTDPTTMHVHANLILNFCLDVVGYGVIGVFVAWLIWTRASWMAYFMGVLLVGISDVSFTFLQLTSGVIALNVPTVSGPVVWALALLITPFGMPRLSRDSFREAY